MVSEFITPGVIITTLILTVISIWMLIGKLWKNAIVDNFVTREKVFRYFSDLGLYLAANGDNKTKAIYFKSYLALLLVVKPQIQNELEQYNREIIEEIKNVSREKINSETLKLINAFRKAYKIERDITKLWIADLNKK
jgi:hypothetical protein